jgi:hypothetical protein
VTTVTLQVLFTVAGGRPGSGTLVYAMNRWLVVALVVVFLVLAVWASYGFHYK